MEDIFVFDSTADTDAAVPPPPGKRKGDAARAGARRRGALEDISNAQVKPRQLNRGEKEWPGLAIIANEHNQIELLLKRDREGLGWAKIHCIYVLMCLWPAVICHVEQRVFKDLLAKKLPRVAAHLEDLEFDVSLVVTEWFLCLFSKSLPSETTRRVWDILFYEGAKVLFNVALAIFKMKEDELLLTQHVGDVIYILQKTTHHLFDPDELLEVCYSTKNFRLPNRFHDYQHYIKGEEEDGAGGYD